MDRTREQASTRFNQAAEWNDDVWNIQFRVKVAVQRLDARFEKCQHDLTWTRYRHLMDKHTSTLKWYDYLEPVDVSERTWGSRDFPSKNDKVLWRPLWPWPPEGYYFSLTGKYPSIERISSSSSGNFSLNSKW